MNSLMFMLIMGIQVAAARDREANASRISTLRIRKCCEAVPRNIASALDREVSEIGRRRLPKAARQATAPLLDHPANDVTAFRPAGGDAANHGALAFVAEMQKRQQHEGQRGESGGDQDKRSKRMMK
jgi:hypothetical protein